MWQVHELRDERFWKYLYNTVYLMLGIPFAIVGSLSLAMLVNNRFGLSRKPRVLGAAMCLLGGGVTFWLLWTAATPHAPQWALYSNLALLGGVAWLVAALGIVFEVVSFRTLLYLPTFTSGVALMILWKALYNPQTGPINAGLSELCNGFIWLWNCLGHQAAYTQMSDMPQWLGKAAWAKPALIVMGVWTAIGGTNMLLYLSGLSNVPQELLDAAEVDGAGAWGRFRHVIWPQLAPTTFFITIMSIIGGFQGGFEAARVMTQGGPDGSTTTLSYYIYNKFWQDLELGYGAAISWVLFGIIFIATAINWKYGKELEVN
jgi:multiple sugar transport system permease protein